MLSLRRWQTRVRSFNREARVLYWALKDPRTPWYARLAAVCVVAYTLSPIDLIPDPIPVLGYLDDLILVPLGVALVRRMIPKVVLEDCRRQVATASLRSPLRWLGLTLIVILWLLALGLVAWALLRCFVL